jgi:nitric oxide reductase activation protein
VLPVPVGPEIDGPGLDGLPRESREHHSGTGRSWSRPQPYIALEDTARPLAQRIVETLQEPRPNVRPRADATSGRYSYRLEARDWERPFQKCADMGRAPRSLALYLLVDWSSSMRSNAPGVKLAMMALHVAAEQLRLPHAITFFGAGRDAALSERLETIVAFTDRGEWPKALIAGYEPSAGNEYLFAGLDRAAEELQSRPERDKIILCVHDGQPVWSGREGRDWDLSIAQVKTAEQKGIRVIGLFLGEDEEELRRMKLLFPHLIVTTPERLPEKLGAMVISLAR